MLLNLKFNLAIYISFVGKESNLYAIHVFYLFPSCSFPMKNHSIKPHSRSTHAVTKFKYEHCLEINARVVQE